MYPKLEIDGQPPKHHLTVTKGKINQQFSHPGKLEITAVSNSPDLDPNDYVGHKATLRLVHDPGGQVTNRFDGIIYLFRALNLPSLPKHVYAYRMVVGPKPWELGFAVKSKIYRNKTVPEAMKQVLVDAGLSEGTDFKFKLLDASVYTEQEQLVQYQASALEFLDQLGSENGIFNYNVFDGSKDQPEVLTFADDRSFLPELLGALPYHPGKGLVKNQEHISSFKPSKAYVPGKISILSHKYLSASEKYSSQRSVDKGGAAEVSFYDYPQASSDANDRQALLMSEEMQSLQWEANGNGNVSGLRVGMKFALNPDPTGNSGNKYMCFYINHLFSRSEERAMGDAKSGVSYSNSFFAAKGDAPWRPERLRLRLDHTGFALT